MKKENKKAIIAGLAIGFMALALVTTTVACAAAFRTKATGNIVLVNDVTEDPNDPTETTDPADPEDPEDPTDPVDPEEPGTENPDDPEDPSEPETPEIPETPEEPGEPEDPQPEEPDPVEVPEIDSTKTYTVFELVDMFKEFHEELNGSFIKIKVRVAGQAAGARGCCWFQDINDEAIEKSSQITQERMVNMIARPDQGDNNDYYYKIQGKITTITGTVTYEHSTFFGVDCLFIR